MTRFRIFLFCLFSAPLAAKTINWGDSIGGLDLTSSGGQLDSSFTFGLGTFGKSFSPNSTNVSDWIAHWKLLDKANYNEPLDWFSGKVQLTFHDTVGADYFTSDYDYAADPDFQAPNHPGNYHFEPGEQIYIWIYNSKDPVPGTEWGLYTRTNSTNPLNPTEPGDFSWRIPSGPADQTAFPSSFYMPHVDTAPFGAALTERGPGEYSNPLPNNYQTATFAPIPEPASIFAFLTAVLATLKRRRSSFTTIPRS